MTDSPPLLTLAAEGPEYTLHAAPDATLFLLHYKPDKRTARLHGVDAARFEADYRATLANFPTNSPDQILAQLWDQGGYSWLATEEEFQ